jgi:hypothetical protein
MTAPQTIFSQLGGNRFALMVGAKNFMLGETSLTFKIMGNAKQVNLVSINLNSSDRYDCRFMRVTKKGCTLKSSSYGLYSHDLRRIFESATGLYTSL